VEALGNCPVCPPPLKSGLAMLARYMLSSCACPSLCQSDRPSVTSWYYIETHPNWPVYADVFEHPPPRLASRRPIWSDMTSVDTVMQWRED